jgi:RecA-family ATPase
MNAGPQLRTADPAAIAIFADSLFRYAEEGSFAALRGFYDLKDAPPYKIQFVPIGTSLDHLISEATTLATNCARAPEPVVFCPPIATFSNSKQAREIDLQNGLALSVECDETPSAARAGLESILGPATLIVESGGEWSDPETGEIQPKLHLHWRLNEPTCDAESHARLKKARAFATRLVGGDPSNKPMVHPIRWAGSWHCKSTPRMARIQAQTENEIDLTDALDRLQEAVAASGKEAPKANGKANEEYTGEERDTAELIGTILSGADYHAPIAALAMRYLKRGMSGAQVVITLRGIMQAVPANLRDLKGGLIQPSRWQSRYDDITRAVATAQQKIGPADNPNTETKPEFRTGWHFISPPTLQNLVVPERRFIVDGWFAPGHVTLNYGDGGVGKTLLAQQLMTSCVTGLPWCGLPVEACRAIGLFCEDDESELHRRQHAINTAYGIDFTDLSLMQWATGVGQDNTLVRYNPNGEAELTSAFLLLEKLAEEFHARVIVVDTAADTFGGNENNRREVRQFIGYVLGRMARKLNAAVLLNAHPSRAGMGKDGDLDGGSTAWSNTARSRWSLARPQADGDIQADSDERILTRRKANYASIGDTIKLRWCNGVLVPTDAPAGLAGMASRFEAEHVFMDLLAKTGAEGRPVSDSRNAGNSAPKLFAQRPDRHGFNRRDFEAAMQRLFATGKIRMVEYGRSGDMRRKITPAGAADA